MIQVQNFTKTYRETVAVSSLSFAVEPGQILGLVGPNGAGKTSTLRSLAGIIPPTLGQLTIAGYDIAADPVNAKKRLAYIPDDPKLFDILTVFEHLQFIAMAYRVEAWEAKADELLRMFELQEQKNTLAQELSRGMRQKLAICCGYLHDPAVVLFDEPHTGLDPRGIRTIKNAIIERARNGASIMVSSHLLELVEDLCTHLLILHRGKSVFFGPMDEARDAVSDAATGGTLEQAFFRITEGDDEIPPPPPGEVP